MVRAGLDGADAAFLDAQLDVPWTAAQIEADFAALAGWSRRHGVPAMLNEFAALNFCVDAPSRARWTRAVRLAADRNGVGWSYWELDQGFGFVGDRTDAASVDMALVDALLGA
jgi:endoglucanase